MIRELAPYFFTLAICASCVAVGFWLGRGARKLPQRQCAAMKDSAYRCEARSDPRCQGGNCTRHCLTQCGCVALWKREAEDKRAAVDLSFLHRGKP